MEEDNLLDFYVIVVIFMQFIFINIPINVQTKINVKSKKCKSLRTLYHDNHWNHARSRINFLLCVIKTYSRNEWRKSCHWNYFLFYIDISISCRDYEGLKVDLRRCTIYEWNSMTYFFPGYTYYAVSGIAFVICLDFGSSQWNEMQVKYWRNKRQR